MTVRRFPIRFTGANRAMVLLGVTRRWSYVEVGPDEVHVRMSWAFGVRAPRATVGLVTADHASVWGWGVHGWRGQWLVNGSSSGIVRIELTAPARGRLLAFPVRVRVLRVAVEDPAGLMAAISPPSLRPSPAAT